MKLYADYIKSREGFECLMIDNVGFLTYKIYGPDLYIRDIYVSECMQDQGYGKQMLKQIILVAQENGCTDVVGSVCPAANNAHQGMMALIHNGFKLFKIDGGLILFKKEI